MVQLRLWQAAWFATVGLILAVLCYVWRKDGGSTGFETYYLLVPNAGLGLLACYGYFVQRLALAKALLVTALFGCLLPFYLEYTQALMPYGRWLAAGMPAGEHIALKLGAFLLMLMTALFFCRPISTKQR